MATNDNVSDDEIRAKLRGAYKLTEKQYSEVMAYVAHGFSFPEAVKLLNETPDLEPSGATTEDIGMDGRIRKAAGVK